MSDPTLRFDGLERKLRLSLFMGAASLLANLGLAYLLFAVVLAEPAQVAGVTDRGESAAPITEEGDYRIEMRAFFVRMEDVLDREARRRGVNPAEVVPTKEQVDAAVETRTMHSDSSQLVLQKLREGFELFDLEWPIAIPER